MSSSLTYGTISVDSNAGRGRGWGRGRLFEGVLGG